MALYFSRKLRFPQQVRRLPSYESNIRAINTLCNEARWAAIIIERNGFMANTFELGRVVATKRVWELIDSDERFNRFVSGCVTRYMMHDWGDLVDEDWAVNDRFVTKKGGRILASYKLPNYVDVEHEDSLWIITEEDRSVTTLLFPGDY